ncbi:MAG: hypothetical protein WKG32_15395 [Gemmatimonadaceae bacterium]
MMASEDWSRFEHVAPAAICSVIAVDWLCDDAICTRLFAFHQRFPLHPVVLVTRKDADNVRHLKGLHVQEVVWPSEVAQTLWPAVRRACARDLLHRLAAAFVKAERLSVELRQALVSACWSEPPVRSVTVLAQMVGCDRRTLWRHWRDAAGRMSPLRLEDVVHWLLLLRAAGRKGPNRGWAVVARELNMHEHTLARSARRLAGCTLSDLSAAGLPALTTTFVQQVIHPLTGTSEWNDMGQ